MSVQQPRYSAEETARRGDKIYERQVRAQVEASHRGKAVAIDIETGAYAVGETARVAAKRLLARRPEAEIWLARIGHRALRRIGSGSRRAHDHGHGERQPRSRIPRPRPLRLTVGPRGSSYHEQN